MLFLRSLVANALLYPLAFLLTAVSLPVWVLRRRWAHRAASIWARATLDILHHVCGITMEVRGKQHMPRAPMLIASKHQSSWETAALFVLMPNIAIVMRQIFFYFTPLGWLCWRSGMLPINRLGGASALRRLLRDSSRALAQGKSVCIFPEGTRRAPGAPPLYHNGVAGLYTHLQVPCVPVALNTGLFWPRRQFLRYPGRVVMEFLPPIAPGMPRKAFMQKLETQIEEASNRLLAEARRDQS